MPTVAKHGCFATVGIISRKSRYYTGTQAAAGQMLAQAPQSVHSEALILYGSPSVMQLVGHSLRQALQQMHSSVILYAMTKLLLEKWWLYGLNPLYSRNPFLDSYLYPILQCYRRHRTAVARSLQAHLHHTALDIDQFHISTVGLQDRTNYLGENLFNFVLQFVSSFRA
jgi:hypothetical protein